MYVLRTGCQWKALPKERFGSASSIHAYFLQWLREGFCLRLWRVGLAEYDELEGIAWKWQSIDGAMVKAPLARLSQFTLPKGYFWLRITQKSLNLQESVFKMACSADLPY